MANYLYKEAIRASFVKYIKPQFVLNTSPSNEAILIRLLTGTVTVTNILSFDSFDQFNNYSILGVAENKVLSSKPIRECVQPDFDIDNLCKYLDGTKYINHSFFEDLLEELTCYFYKKSRYSYTTAFLHLYRSLEYISYSFPLIYASIGRQYQGSFNTMRDYFIGKSSEVIFFDEFTRELLEPSLLDAPLTFNFSTLDPAINRNHFNIIKRILGTDSIDDEVSGIYITTSYKYLIKLGIDLRNRYFHFATGGQRNIRGSEIVENDIFFSIINEELLNWIAIIYFEILRASLRK